MISCSVLSYPVLSHLVLSCSVLSSPVLSYLILSCSVLSYPVLLLSCPYPLSIDCLFLQETFFPPVLFYLILSYPSLA